MALDGSCHIRDTEQLFIFVRNINNTFGLTEELVSVQSIKDFVTGKDLLIEIEECVSNLDLDWGKLVNVTTDGCPSFTGKNKELLKKLKIKFMKLIKIKTLFSPPVCPCGLAVSFAVALVEHCFHCTTYPAFRSTTGCLRCKNHKQKVVPAV